MIGDYLKKFRKNDYSKGDGEGDMKSGDDKPMGHSRIISFTDDEQKMFQGTPPGEDLACEVHGKLDSEGKFQVMSIAPLGGGEDYGDGDQQDMAGKVAQRVTPTVQLSPS